MLKRGTSVLIIILVTISNVYSLSLFPNNEDIIYNNIKLDKVSIKDNYIELLITSNTNVDNLIINVDKETINLPITINKYESKLVNFYTNTTNPTSLIIYFYKNTNHKLVEIDRISYTFTGNEDNPVNKQDIPILKQENNQLLLDDNPDYISYSSISKLTNNKEITYYTRDHISSNRITTNNQGNTVYQANFQPYGNIFTETNQEKYKFSNKELDSSNLYYFGARYYNSNTGRFTQVDPIYNPSISPYSYANNNTLKYVDPTGKQVKYSSIVPSLSFKATQTLASAVDQLIASPELKRAINPQPASQFDFHTDIPDTLSFVFAAKFENADSTKATGAFTTAFLDTVKVDTNFLIDPIVAVLPDSSKTLSGVNKFLETASVSNVFEIIRTSIPAPFIF